MKRVGVCRVRQWTTVLLSLWLWCASGLWLGLPAAQDATLIVVRSPEQSSWDILQGRLERLNLPYRVVNLSDLNLNRLGGAKVIFLPGVTRMSTEQAYTIRQWVQQGGRLIGSGPVGMASDPEVREVFKQLFGAYWGEDLAGLDRLEVEPAQEWAKRGNINGSVQGGLLVRTDLGSTIAARWAGNPERPAVLTTPESIYLGWNWGSASALFDREWLMASLERFVPGVAANQYKVAPVEAAAMQKELESVLGRVESALLTSDASSNDPQKFPQQYRDAIAHARQTLKDLPGLLKGGMDIQARAAWEEAIEDLWTHYPTSPLTALPEVRAIWLDRGTIVSAGSEQALTLLFDRLAKAGINTVFFETVNAGYTIYPSSIAPTQNPLINNWDPLAAAVRLAHERRMELHAWVWVFAAGNTRHNVKVNLPQEYPGPVLTAHPDWAQKGLKGNLRPAGQPEFWLDPANPEVQAYLDSLFREIVERYDVDGLQLDYIRYPIQKSANQYFGYSTAARKQFQELTGVDPIGLTPQSDSSLWRLWIDFRTAQVSTFVNRVSQTLREAKPDIILSAAVFPEPTPERVRIMQQDWEAWATAGKLDVLVPMTYALNTRRLQQLVEPALGEVKNAPVLFVPSLNLMSLPQVQLRDQLQAVRDLPAGGYSLFAMAHLNDNQQQLLGQAASASELIPFRQPVRTAVERFGALKKEWDFLAERKQIWVPEFSVQPWQNQTKRTQAALETLMKQQSVGWVQTARAELEKSRKGLNEWLRLERLMRPYRMQTWDNRLQALDTLLRYAEARLSRQSSQAKSGKSVTTGL